jgi:hypothetical protein
MAKEAKQDQIVKALEPRFKKLEEGYTRAGGTLR